MREHVSQELLGGRVNRTPKASFIPAQGKAKRRPGYAGAIANSER